MRPLTFTVTGETWTTDGVTLDFEIVELRLTMAEYEAMDEDAQAKYRDIVRFVDVSELPVVLEFEDDGE